MGKVSSPGSTFCADSYFGICSSPVTAVACKRSQSVGQKCRWQRTTKYACTLCLCTSDMTKVHGCMVYTECVETAAVSCDTSHVTPKQCCKYTTSVDLQTRDKQLRHLLRITYDMSTVSLLKSGEQHHTKAITIIKPDQHKQNKAAWDCCPIPADP